MLAVEKSSPLSVLNNSNSGCSPLGKTMLTEVGNSLVIRAVKAALVAALAQAPVVQPRRREPEGLSVMVQ
jgi:hypothetical protein